MSEPALERPPQQSLGPPPDRRPNSIRRTSSIETTWPEGIAGPMSMACVARDLWTGADPNQVAVIGDEAIDAVLAPDRQILALKSGRVDLSNLVGLRPRGQLGKAIAERFHEEVSDRTLLNRLLDDIASASFIAMNGWSAWTPDWVEQYTNAGLGDRIHRDVTDVCIGFRHGSPAVLPTGRSNIAILSRTKAKPPHHPTDPHAWHAFGSEGGPNQRRLRRLDIWEDSVGLKVDTWFQDSSALRDDPGQRAVIHEYRLEATIAPDDLTLKSVRVTPGVLPYGACRAAVTSPEVLLNQALPTFDRGVPKVLEGPAGCTHLNDQLRSLHDVVGLTPQLRRQRSAAP